MKILFYGDSNTWGYDAKDASRQKNRFTQFIKQEFSQHEIIEEGLCGRTLCLDDPYDEDRNGTKMISMVLVPQFFVVCPPKMNRDGLNNERTKENFGDAGFEILNNTKPYLEKGCRDFDVEVIDTHAIAGSIDGIHMDESGHKQVADVLISLIQEL